MAVCTSFCKVMSSSIVLFAVQAYMEVGGSILSQIDHVSLLSVLSTYHHTICVFIIFVWDCFVVVCPS